MKISERLKSLRLKIGLSQRDLCDKFHFSYTQYNNWERGRAEPDIAALIELSTFYNVSIDYLVGKTDDASISNFEIEFKKMSPQDQLSFFNLMVTVNKKK